MLQINNLTIRYPGVLAVNDLSLELETGRIFGLVGPNGAGKSTLIRALVGMITEFEGKILYDGDNFLKNRQAVKKKTGYAPENPELIPYLTGREFLSFIGDIKKTNNPEEIDKLAADLGFADVLDELAMRYSHGMGQKLSFAAALLGRPKYIILDEALNGFDPVSLYNARQQLNQKAKDGAMILLSSHVLELLENWSDTILVMHEGRLLARYEKEQMNEIKRKTAGGFSDHFIELIRRS